MSKTKCKVEYRANFLWPHEDGSLEQAGYEFINGYTEEYRKQWWEILKSHIKINETK